ncbi:MAG: dockerin type I domain-containing protein [Ruminococcus sp.]|nr:dockerin type I domain-containing protein [Ruminococcus sp.]
MKGGVATLTVKLKRFLVGVTVALTVASSMPAQAVSFKIDKDTLDSIASADTKINRYRYGDVNDDGKIDVYDVTEMQKAIVELTQFNALQNELSDVDGDGRFSVSDITVMQGYLTRVEEFMHYRVGKSYTPEPEPSTVQPSSSGTIPTTTNPFETIETITTEPTTEPIESHSTIIVPTTEPIETTSRPHTTGATIVTEPKESTTAYVSQPTQPSTRYPSFTVPTETAAKDTYSVTKPMSFTAVTDPPEKTTAPTANSTNSTSNTSDNQQTTSTTARPATDDEAHSETTTETQATASGYVVTTAPSSPATPDVAPPVSNTTDHTVLITIIVVILLVLIIALFTVRNLVGLFQRSYERRRIEILVRNNVKNSEYDDLCDIRECMLDGEFPFNEDKVCLRCQSIINRLQRAEIVTSKELEVIMLSNYDLQHYYNNYMAIKNHSVEFLV